MPCNHQHKFDFLNNQAFIAADVAVLIRRADVEAVARRELLAGLAVGASGMKSRAGTAQYVFIVSGRHKLTRKPSGSSGDASRSHLMCSGPMHGIKGLHTMTGDSCAHVIASCEHHVHDPCLMTGYKTSMQLLCLIDTHACHCQGCMLHDVTHMSE